MVGMHVHLLGVVLGLRVTVEELEVGAFVLELSCLRAGLEAGGWYWRAELDIRGRS